jgi:hypothetical protein
MDKGDVMAEQTETWKGGCLCGAVTYESTKMPLKENSGYCHCRMCQKAHGNGFNCFIGFTAKSFRVTRGEPTIYRSSNVGERGFCGRCGSPFTMRYSTLPDVIYVYVGTMDRAQEMERYMDSHVCIEGEIPWLTIHDDLPRQRSDEVETYASAGLSVEEGEPQ